MISTLDTRKRIWEEKDKDLSFVFDKASSLINKLDVELTEESTKPSIWSYMDANDIV